MVNNDLTKITHGMCQNTYHLIWTTKYRFPTFISESMKKIFDYLLRVASFRYGIEILEYRILKDHVHLFARLPHTMSVAKAFHLLKGFVSYRLRKMHPNRKKYKALWSSFCFSRTVGSVTGNVIEHYIRESNIEGCYGLQTSLKQF